MSDLRLCPNCRSAVPADAPEGVCPVCAMRAGFFTEGPEATTRSSPARPSPPLSEDELARRLPELDAFELIGQGGMGSVYRARHRRLDRLVAVKLLDAALQHDPAFAERFTREARTLAQLSHPNIVSVYDFGQRDGCSYLIMELVDGVNLRQMIRAGGLRPEQALALVPRICDALQYAHDRGVVHRDIKPENILVDRAGAIKIADFGLAKIVGRDDGRRITRTAQIMGTPSYMAPEQIETPDRVDHRADIFALGVVFYEMLTGQLPVGRFPPPSQSVQIDVRLDEVVLRTLEREPSLRYQQASELGTDVETIASPGAAAAVRTTPPAARVDQARAGARRRGFEYRTERTVFGVPLVHIAFSRDPEGRQMDLALGVIAIGDVAVGAIAFGGFAFGGLTFGGLSAGLMSFGGIALGLLTAIAGVSLGGFVVGGFAVGLVARGAAPYSLFQLAADEELLLTQAAWLAMTLAITTAVVAALYAGIVASRARHRGGR